jgi:hypothetical protein
MGSRIPTLKSRMTSSPTTASRNAGAFLASVLTATLLLPRCAHNAEADPVITVAEATVIGFATDATHEDHERANDIAVAHDDFVTSWPSFAAWAGTAGITVRTSAPRFTIEVAGGARIRVREGEFGYVLVEPSGRRHVIHGVPTDAEVIAAVCWFFSASRIQSACAKRE